MQVEETQTSMTNGSLKPTRAGFIRSLPLAMAVEEVIERGREAGLELQPSDIHAARYYMRQAAAAEAASKPPTIAQQLMLGGTISASRDQDETAGLTKIAGVRNGATRVNGRGAVPETNTASSAATQRETRAEAKEAKVVEAKSKRRERAVRGAVREPKRLAEISIDDVLQLAAPKSRGNGRGRAAPSIDGSMEEQLHNLVLRLGTQRAREIIGQIEETALSAS